MYTGQGDPVCECTAERTLGVRFCPIHPRWQPGVTKKKVPKSCYKNIYFQTKKVFALNCMIKLQIYGENIAFLWHAYLLFKLMVTPPIGY